jgi:hypothetical protein
MQGVASAGDASKSISEETSISRFSARVLTNDQQLDGYFFLTEFVHNYTFDLAIIRNSHGIDVQVVNVVQLMDSIS